ncbi:MAG TPA: adenylate/guanylate cyclase domain-containing protein [Solirubrobacterales bacterium]|jgi:adenylate cyclase
MALIAIGIAAVLSATPLLTPFEDWSLDRRLSLRGERAPDPDIVVVAINQPSLDALGERWPIGRRHYADLIDRLSGAGVKVIAFTTEFDAPTTPRDDTRMIESMRHAGTVVLAATAADDKGETHILGGSGMQRRARVRVGMANLPADNDKTIRHLEWSIQGLPTLPLEVSRRLGRPPDPSALHDGRTWIDIRGRPCEPDRPSSCAIPTYGFSEVLNMSAPRARRVLGGKVVVVGVTASGAGHPVAVWGPGRDLTSAPHLVALQVATVLRGFPLQQASWLLGALFLVLGGFLPMVLDGLGRRALGARRQAVNALNGWFGALLTGGFGALGIVVLSGIAVLAFDRGTVIPIGAPLLAAFLATSLGVINRYHADTLNAQRLYAAADSVVPKEYVGELLARCEDPDHDTAKIEKGTVIFVDVIGFTVFTMALMNQPDRTPTECTMDVLRFAAKFQELVVERVFKHDGVIVDLMGDGVLAAFGLVGRSKEHEELALQTAHKACTDVVRSMREWLKEQGWEDLVAEHRDKYKELEGVDDFDVRVGLDSGEVAVGLTGHESSLEFSVIAAPTIGAARLKDEAKRLDVTLCASDSTFNSTVSIETRELIPAELQDEPIELRGQKGKRTFVYTWTRDDARYGLVPRQR